MRLPKNSPPSKRRVTGFFKKHSRGFTLAEVLAALVLMAIVIPVAMEGVSVASRAGTLGYRKAAASRVAQRVLNEAIITNQVSTSGAGTTTESDTPYEWKLETAPWTVDALELVTVRVTFSVQGSTYDVAVSTLYDPASATASATL